MASAAVQTPMSKRQAEKIQQKTRAAEHALTLMSLGEKRGKAVQAAVERFGLSASTVERTMRSLRKGEVIARKPTNAPKRVYTEAVQKLVLQFVRDRDFAVSVDDIVDHLLTKTGKGSAAGVQRMLKQPEFQALARPLPRPAS